MNDEKSVLGVSKVRSVVFNNSRKSFADDETSIRIDLNKKKKTTRTVLAAAYFCIARSERYMFIRITIGVRNVAEQNEITLKLNETRLFTARSVWRNANTT